MIMVAFRRVKQLSVRHSQSQLNGMGREAKRVSRQRCQTVNYRRRERERESERGGEGSNSFKTHADIAKTLEQSTEGKAGGVE